MDRNILSSKPNHLLVAFPHYDILQSNFPFLRENMQQLEAAVQYMKVNRCFSDHDVNAVTGNFERSREERIGELIRLIQNGTHDHYDMFLEFLCETNQKEILKQLGEGNFIITI